MRSLVILLAATVPLGAQTARPAANTAPVLAGLDAAASHYATIAKQIWTFAEVGYMEEKSSALLQSKLRGAGFTVKAGVAGEPTAFVAEYGSGKPVIAILGEFDALPGLSQDSVPERKPLRAGGPGHGCGHHLFGTASAAAAIALKQWMQTNNVRGTLRMIGTPAEEGGSGKVYMVRDGVFADVDAVIAWHPGDENSVTGERTMANISGKFRFRGVSAHAAAAPERGRSALDAVEAMDFMTNALREHIPDGSRTTYDLQLVGSVYSLLPNETLAKVKQRALEQVGGFTYTAEERAFAERLQKSDAFTAVPLETTAKVKPLSIGAAGAASTDVGDVSWVVPTVQLSAATWVPGTAAHSWQAVAAGGTTIGYKGMMVAAKTMALTGADLFTSPATIEAAKAELVTRRGPGFKYETALGTQAPQLDYRKGSVP